MKRNSLHRKTPLRTKVIWRIKSTWKSLKRNKPLQANPHRYDPEQTRRLLERSGGRCEAIWDGVRCNSKGDWRGLMRHHLTFKSHCGKDTDENMIIVCARCQSRFHSIKEV